MSILIATAESRVLTHRPYTDKNGKSVFKIRTEYHFEDDKGNKWNVRAVDSDADFDTEAFLIPLGASGERHIAEQLIREDEEAKAASELTTLEQAVENKRQVTEDAINARLEMEVSRG